jgi:xylem cysteine proteinase
MKLVLALLAVVAFAFVSALPLTEQQYEFLFTRFVSQYNKEYNTNQFFAKYNTFKANLNTIITHNAKGLSYTMAMNEFGDLTFEEFSSKLGLKAVKRDYARSLNTADLSKVRAGDFKDWREEGAVNVVKNQGDCSSCWALSAVAAIEGEYQIKHGKLYDLSESQLIDCSASYGNEGCNGGLMDYAFEYAIANGGLCQAEDYPYEPLQGHCKASTCEPAATISGYKNVKANDEKELVAAISSTVVSVVIKINRKFQFYSSGIFTGPCGTTLQHSVAVVGYDLGASSPYYIVRNSWSKLWGEDGYIRMAYGKNLCGIAEMASYVQA